VNNLVPCPSIGKKSVTVQQNVEEVMPETHHEDEDNSSSSLQWMTFGSALIAALLLWL